MISLLLCVLVITCSSYIGWGIQNYYKSRIVFYENIDNFLHYLSNNINFYKDSINAILKEYVETSSDSKHLKNIISSYLKGNMNCEAVIIKKEEKQLVKNIFSHLGKSDSENQIAGFANFSTQVQLLAEKCRQDYEKEGKIATKLGILFGLALAICLL